MISVDQALVWVTWASFTFGSLGLCAGATLAFAARWEERTPAPELAQPSAQTVRARRGGAL